MKFSLHVNQKQALELGIKNINQAIILDLLCGAASWARTQVIDDDVYYWVARQTISNELEILNLKPDTVYRHLIKLDELGLINYLKHGKKDCIKITELGRSYYVGNESDQCEQPVDNSAFTMSEIDPKNEQNSEIDPNYYIGNESEKHSDLNPTYQTTISISLLISEARENFINAYPKKVRKLDLVNQWEKLDKKHNLTNRIDMIVNDIANRLKHDREWLNGYYPDPINYIKGERWNDEIQKSLKNDGVNDKPEWQKLPTADDDLWPWAKRWKYPSPGQDQYPQYRQRLSNEIEKRIKAELREHGEANG